MHIHAIKEKIEARRDHMVNRNDKSEPLYYIDQPQFTAKIEQPGQRMVVKKQVGEKKRKKGGKKRKQYASHQHREVSEGRSTFSTTTDQEKQQKLTKKEEVPTSPAEIKEEDTSVQEMIQYVKELPHYIDPVIACETKDKRIQGLVVTIDEKAITLLNEADQLEYTLDLKEIEKMYIVSL